MLHSPSVGQTFHLRFWLFSASILLYLLASNPTAAQIIPDNTLPNNSIVPINCADCEITGGTTIGNNLFHSFEQFSVPVNGIADFNNAGTIENIISRVTGRSASEVDGLIRTSGTTNLFLLNPNGILFGPNASLDIRGSFIASTAHSLILQNGAEFSAIPTQTTPLLTINTPLGIGFGGTPTRLRLGESPGRIVNQSIALDVAGNPIGLQVPLGETLALVGGEIALESGFLTTPGGRLELGSVSGNNSVNLTPIAQGWMLGYEGIQNFQDISLSPISFIGSSNPEGADIQLQGRRITLESSQISTTSQTGQAGDLTVRASELVELIGTITLEGFIIPSGLFNEVQEEATGRGATLTIETEQLIVRDGAQVSTTTSSSGQGVNLRVNALESVELIGTSAEGMLPNGRVDRLASGLFSAVNQNAIGNGGTLTIETRQLIAQGGGQASTSTLGMGHAGNLVVSALESVSLAGRAPGNIVASGLSAQTGEEARGNAGELTIVTGQLVVLGGAQISSNTFGSGRGGTVHINASDSVRLSGTAPIDRPDNVSGILVTAERGATNDAGNLDLTTRQLIVADGARLSADNFGSGSHAGNINLDVQQLILNRGAINAETRAGDGANIILRVQDLLLMQNQSRITASALNNANGGNIVISSARIVAAPFTDSDIVARAVQGNGGVILITTQDITGIEERRAIEGNGTNDIDASSEFGTSGAVLINSTDLGGVELPATPVTTQLGQACGGGDVASTSRFISSGRSGLPTNPYEPLSSSEVLADVQPPEAFVVSSNRLIRNSSRHLENAEPIVEAQGWRIDEQGKILLVAEAIDLAAPTGCQVP